MCFCVPFEGSAVVESRLATAADTLFFRGIVERLLLRRRNDLVSRDGTWHTAAGYATRWNGAVASHTCVTLSKGFYQLFISISLFSVRD